MKQKLPPIDKKTEAAILQYGEDAQRSEYCIVIKSNDWMQLRDILWNPMVTLGSLGMLNSEVDWKVLSNVTLVLEPVLYSVSAAVSFATAFNLINLHGTEGEGDKSVNAFSNLQTEAFAFKVGAQAINTIRKVRDLEEGAFVLNFSTMTRTIVVRYRSPEVKKGQSPPDPLFKGKLMPSTGVPINGTTMGNIHFDIDAGHGNEELNRANLIMDYIQNPASVMDQIRKQKCYKGVAYPKLVKKQTIPPDPNLAIKPSQPYGCKKPKLGRAPWDPTIVIEGLSMVDPPPTGCNVCIDGVIYPDVPYTNVMVDGVVFKCYARQPH